jgi:hypothetical protein
VGLAQGLTTVLGIWYTGIIYIVDRANTGMHVLKATGKLAAISGR